MIDADNGEEVDRGEIDHTVSKVERGEANNHDLEHYIEEGFVAREIRG